MGAEPRALSMAVLDATDDRRYSVTSTRQHVLGNEQKQFSATTSRLPPKFYKGVGPESIFTILVPHPMV